MIKGVIDINEAIAKNIMVPADRIYSIDIKKGLSYSTVKRITNAGFSRIPVYVDNPHNIVGIMLIKSLIGLDLSKSKTIEELIEEGEIILRKPFYIN